MDHEYDLNESVEATRYNLHPWKQTYYNHMVRRSLRAQASLYKDELSGYTEDMKKTARPLQKLAI